MKLFYFCLLAMLILGCNKHSETEIQGMTNIKNSTELYQAFNGDILHLLADAKKNQDAIVVAHRGGIAPSFAENSRSAIERVINGMPAIVEIDVVASSDGIDFLHHDKTLERTTNGVGLPSEYTWQELSELKLKDQSNRLMTEGLLTFADFLMGFSKKTFLMIDMKSPSSDAQIVAQIEKNEMIKGTVFIVYNIQQALKVREANSEAILALGVKSVDDLTVIRNNGLADKPFISLAGNIQQNSHFFENLIADDHHILSGSYLGDYSLDAEIETFPDDDIKHQLVTSDGYHKRDIRLIVSNQPFSMYKFLCRNQMGLMCSK